MNGYKPETDNKFLTESLEAHKTALAESKLETETAKEFLYQHIQTNKELEKKIDEMVTGIENALHYVNWNHEEAQRILQEVLQIAEEDPSETHTAAHPELYFEK
jgi:hypothetical protein